MGERRSQNPRDGARGKVCDALNSAAPESDSPRKTETLERPDLGGVALLAPGGWSPEIPT